MRILILGSAGQIGSSLCNYLKTKGHEVIEFDIVDNLAFDISILNNENLRKSIETADFVFFLAFDVGGSRYLNTYQNTFGFIDNNIKIMTNTFNLLREFQTKFIFTSTQMSNMIFSNYGILKRIGESYTKTLNGIVVKLWNVYGFETNPEKFHVISDFLYSAISLGEIRMLTDGEEDREFLHVLDCSKALEVLMLNWENVDKTNVYEISSFEKTKIIDIAYLIIELFKYEKKSIKLIRSNAKDTTQQNSSNSPGKEILKYWTPTITLKDGIESIKLSMQNIFLK